MIIRPLRKMLKPLVGHNRGRVIILIGALLGAISLATATLLLFRQPQAVQKDFDDYGFGLFSCSGGGNITCSNLPVT